MRKSPLEEGRRWLEQAEEDLKWTDDLAGRGGLAREIVLLVRALLYPPEPE
ncbi:MAG TPA: hypothetical protein VLK65_11950 [Vicinamibacteria bacterium]|nr:hypothetical protein [Vicinamibacteria bacterium]